MPYHVSVTSVCILCVSPGMCQRSPLNKIQLSFWVQLWVVGRISCLPFSIPSSVPHLCQFSFLDDLLLPAVLWFRLEMYMDRFLVLLLLLLIFILLSCYYWMWPIWVLILCSKTCVMHILFLLGTKFCVYVWNQKCCVTYFNLLHSVNLWELHLLKKGRYDDGFELLFFFSISFFTNLFIFSLLFVLCPPHLSFQVKSLLFTFNTVIIWFFICFHVPATVSFKPNLRTFLSLFLLSVFS